MKLLTKTELSEKIFGLENYQPHSPTTRNLNIKTSSGTTGHGISIVVADGTYAPFTESAMYKYRSQIICNAKNTSQLNNANHRVCESNCDRILNLSLQDLSHPDIAKVIEEFSPEEIVAPPFVVEKILENKSTETKKTILKPLQHFFSIGTDISNSLKKQINTLNPHLTLTRDYGVAEVLLTAASCPYLDQKYPDQTKRLVFHPYSDTLLSIYKPDENGIGEIIISSHELENFKTGDAGQLINEPCPCGKTRTLFFFGRIDHDFIRDGGITLYASEIERVLRKLSEFISDIRVDVTVLNNKEKTSIKIEYEVVPSVTSTHANLRADILTDLLDENTYVSSTQTVAAMKKRDVILSSATKITNEIKRDSYKMTRLRKLS